MKNAGWILGVSFLTVVGGFIPGTFGQDGSKKSAWLGTVKPDKLEIHTEPSPTSHIIGYVNKGTSVSVDLKTTVSGEAWCEITVAGYNVAVGYVPCNTLEHDQHAESSNVSPVALPPPASAEKAAHALNKGGPLANRDVLDMLKMGLSPEIVAAKIKGSTCTFDTSPSALDELKTAGVPDPVILAMVQAPATTQAAAPAVPVTSPASKPPESAQVKEASLDQPGPHTPRVFITDSQSWEMSGGFGASNGSGGGSVSGGARPQTAEVIKTFNERCPELTVTNDKTKANYVVILDHEGGKGYLRHRNKIAVFNRDGDAIFSDSTRSLGNSVKDACEAIRKSLGHTRQK